jgi:hypothetical protein
MKSKKEVTKQMLSAYQYGQKLVEKAQNPNEKFLNHEPMCKLCLGSGTRTVYQYGRPSRKRCEASTWDSDKKRLICAGISNWQEVEKENKKDLSSEIWKIVVREKLKEAFMFFLKQDYHTESLSNLLTQQLYTILSMLQSGRLLTVLSWYQSKTQKAA